MTKLQNAYLSVLSLAGAIGIVSSAVSCSETVICSDCGALPTVSIEMRSGNDYSQCRVLFTPAPGTEHFTYFLGTEDDLSSFEDGSLIGVESLSTDRPQEVIFYDLKFKQEYMVYARAYNADGVPGGVAAARFFNGQKIEIETKYATDNSAGVSIKMGDDWSSCRYYLGTPDEKSDFVNGKIPGDTLVDIDRFIVNGFDLMPETEYALYVLPINRMGVAYGLMEHAFVTAAKGSCPDFTLDFNTNNPCLVEPVLTPNEKCGRIMALISLSTTEGTMNEMTDVQMLERNYNGDVQALFAALDASGRVQKAYNGNPLLVQASLRSLLECGRELEMLVMLYDKEGNYTGTKFFTFSTPDIDAGAGQAEATVEIVDVINGGSDWGVYHTVKAIIHPNENTLGYFMRMMSVDEYEQMIKQEDGENKLREQMMNDWSYTTFVYGNQPYAFVNDRIYSWYTKNCIVVCPFNINGKDGWGPITAEYFEIK